MEYSDDDDGDEDDSEFEFASHVRECRVNVRFKADISAYVVLQEANDASRLVSDRLKSTSIKLTQLHLYEQMKRNNAYVKLFT